MASTDEVFIEFTQHQKRTLAARHGITADGLVIETKSKTLALRNARAEAAFPFTSDQAQRVEGAGISAVGVTIDPKSFSVDIVRPGDVPIAMWGEYAADY